MKTDPPCAGSLSSILRVCKSDDKYKVHVTVTTSVTFKAALSGYPIVFNLCDRLPRARLEQSRVRNEPVWSGGSVTDAQLLVGGYSTEPAVPAESIQIELQKILSSHVFSASGRLRQFLRFVVEQSLRGQRETLKESVLGVRVFGRGHGFDPRLDAIVRVEAGRLRAKLAEYYEIEGRQDPVLIELHKGGYAPVFHDRNHTPAAPHAVTAPMAGRLASNHTQSARLTSIVVLPFLNLSADPENDYFSDGLTEEVISGLTRIPGLRVIARSTAFRYKGQAQDIRKVGTELNVSAALEGSVRRIGDHLRITTQLVDTVSCFHIWSDSYELEIRQL
jgi:adenylate cyclase